MNKLPYTLSRGSHRTFKKGTCALELVDYMDRMRNNEKVGPRTLLTDRPDCVCPILRKFFITLNDGTMDDEARTRLLGPYLVRLLDTKVTPRSSRSCQKSTTLTIYWLITQSKTLLNWSLARPFQEPTQGFDCWSWD